MIGRAWSTCKLRLPILTSPRLVQGCGRLGVDRHLFSGPVRKFAEADCATGLFVLWDLVFVFATFLHIVAVAGLDPIGAVDLLSHRALLRHGVKDTGVIGREGWCLLKMQQLLVCP